jgi:hypothetical protein
MEQFQYHLKKTHTVIHTRDDLITCGNYLFKAAPKMLMDVMLENYGAGPDDDIINIEIRAKHTAYLF